MAAASKAFYQPFHRVISLPSCRALAGSSQAAFSLRSQKRAMATVATPVTQSSTSSKGPTAMVFMNMGGPQTTDEVGDFLSRLFVRQLSHPSPYSELAAQLL